MRVFAFQGLRYTAEPDVDPGQLAAPPYDQIPEPAAADYHALSPYHFSRLSRPAGEGVSRYRHAAELHELWRAERIVAADAEPALYPYRIRLRGGGDRLGLCAMLGLEPPGSGVIRPHEATLAKPLADRLALLEAMEIDLEPALVVAEDDGELEEMLAADMSAASPLVAHTDGAGHRHELYRVAEQRRIDRYGSLLSDTAATIADGHHRFEVARRFADKYGLDSGPAAAKLAVVTSVESEGLTIDPIHRALADAAEPEAAAELADDRFTVEAETGADVARRVAVAGGTAVAVRFRRGTPEIWTFDRAIDEPRHELAVVLLHERIFPRLGLSVDAATDGTVRYRSDPDELYEMTETGDAALGFWLPPMDPSAFAAAVAGGRMLPPKSTRFVPKVVSGLVWCGHDAELA